MENNNWYALYKINIIYPNHYFQEIIKKGIKNLILYFFIYYIKSIILIKIAFIF